MYGRGRGRPLGQAQRHQRGRGGGPGGFGRGRDDLGDFGRGGGGHRGRGGPPSDGGQRGRGRPYGRGNRGTGHHRQVHDENVNPMELDTLMNLSMKSNIDVLMAVAAPTSGFEKTLQTTKSDSMVLIEYVILILEKMSSAEGVPALLSQMLHKLVTSVFILSCVVPFLSRIAIERSAKDKRCYCLAVANITEALLKLMPARSADLVTAVLGQLHLIIRTATDSDIKESLETRVMHIETLQKEIVEQIQGGRLIKEQGDLTGDDEIEPPNNFRQVSIVPLASDLRQDVETYLRKNKVTGTYRDADQYLDIQFRLLREDYMMPLRKGIQEIVRCGDGKINEKYIQDVKIYNNVHNYGTWYSQKGIIYRFQFDVTALKRVRWEVSSRLIYGSLVCLSSDNFQTITTGTVAERDPKMLRDGFIDILINNTQFLDPSPYVNYKMVECSAYFEAYRYNLEGLQEMNNRTLPFQPYLLNQEADRTDAPRYLQGRNITYDFAPLLKKKRRSLFGHDRHAVRVLDKKDWPSADELSLDASQYKAVQMAITKEFSIIQGPPGTGKTFIGLKIVQLLLHNFNEWGHGLLDDDGRRGNSPILIVCYTNHALDQFLEGILQFSDNGDGRIVRVGGRSSSENQDLQNCLIGKLKRSDNVRDVIPREVKEGKSGTFEQMKIQEDFLSNAGLMLTRVSSSIIEEMYLLKFMLPLHKQWFEFMKGQKKSCIAEWLLGTYQNQNVNPQVQGQEHWDEGIATAYDNYTDVAEDDHDDVMLQEDDEEAFVIEQERRLDNADEDKERLGNISKNMLNMPGNQGPSVDAYFHNQPNIGGWHTVRSKKKMRKFINSELAKKDCMSEQEEAQIGNLLQLPLPKRWSLYRLWIQRLCTDCVTRMQNGMEEFNQLAQRLHELRDEEEFYVLRRARVIAMTTTGAAKYRHLLRRIQPRIVIVEEAAEVLEAHIVTSLSENTQHLILIGDHQQLRPNPTVYELAKNYHLDISLFERMLSNSMHCESLTVQHRMRPDVAKLIVPHIYKKLENHHTVETYEDIHGIGGNVFFISHDHLESETFDTKSRTNKHEAEFLTSLAKYLLQQGYEPSQITILTTYRGQMYEIKKRTRSNPITTDVRVTPVDNYQGEENDIILLSLVRSNEEGRVGFIQISNRICVALSRAKKGLFVIGNIKFICEASSVWRRIMKDVETRGGLVEGMPLVCQNHPDSTIIAVTANDFGKAPEGGCSKPCEARLKCGHVCALKCHPTDQDHKQYKCRKPCIKKLCAYGHNCPKQCYKECDECQVLVEKLITKCGHTQMVPCFMPADLFTCQEPCAKYLTCMHICPKKCGEKCIDNSQCTVPVPDRRWPCGHYHSVECNKNEFNYPCPNIIDKTLPCGHSASMKCSDAVDSIDCNVNVQVKLCDRGCVNNVPCHMKDKITSSGCQVVLDKICDKNREHKFKAKCSEYEDATCGLPCAEHLPCGHSCQGKCGDCKAKRVHQPCKCDCDRPLPCQHHCKAKCGDVCSPCTERCNKVCPHGVCRKPCGEECYNCRAPCTWSCQHKRCTKLCSESCDRTACDRPCPKPLRCGHKCSGYCGEPCPSACLVCNSQFYQQIFTSLNIQPQKGERYVLMLPCNHPIPVTQMDIHVRQYLDQLDQIPRQFRLIKCPYCNAQVQYCPRYHRAVRGSQRDLNRVKSVAKASHLVTSKLNSFSNSAILADRLKELADNDYARKCLGCLSVIGETAAIIEKAKRAKDKIGERWIKQMQKDLDAHKETLQSLILKDIDPQELKTVICQTNLHYIECSARYMTTYVKNPTKQMILNTVTTQATSAQRGESRHQMRHIFDTCCERLQNTIPPGLRNGVDDFKQHLNKFYGGLVDFNTSREWYICAQAHAVPVPVGTLLEDVPNMCQTCQGNGQGQADTDSSGEDEVPERYQPLLGARVAPRARIAPARGLGQADRLLERVRERARERQRLRLEELDRERRLLDVERRLHRLDINERSDSDDDLYVHVVDSD